MSGEKSFSQSYAESGVDITAGYEAVRLMKRHVARTLTSEVIGDIGGFGGFFAPDMAGVAEPVLVSGTDGVGTKLRLAFIMDRHSTVGIDCVAMCVNDIVCCGARPLFFLDYIALGKNVPERVAEIVSGVAEGCVRAGAALIGGETAEMPGFYGENEYDMAGFAVGLADKARLLGPERVCAGDAILALPSSGVHSNGFSLVRRVFNIDRDPDALKELVPALNKTLGDALIEPTSIYVKPVLALARAGLLNAAAHITGGGFFENIPRFLPEGLSAKIEKSSVRTPALFSLIAERGQITERDMFNTFNMGVGMALAVNEKHENAALALLRAEGVDAYRIGTVENGEKGVELW